MGQSLIEIAQTLKDANKKVQLIYAFNGTGKTRLSSEFKNLISPKASEETSENKVIYYNAFTEDLFYWDNDLDFDTNRKLIIQPNDFTNWLLENQGMDRSIISHFQHYTSKKLTPHFNEKYTTKNAEGDNIEVKAYSEITFSIQGGDDDIINNVKISKGEESSLIWCIFYSLLERIVEQLNIPELDNRETDQFNNLKYVFIDDPVSSLDENHLIELAVNLATIIKESTQLKFIISTHNPLFFNVLHNEISKKTCYMLKKNEDNSYELSEKKGDSNLSFSYHLYILQLLKKAVKNNRIEKYHFMLLRNLYEKTASFLGYPRWAELLPDDKQLYYKRIIQFTSHSTLSNEAISEPSDPEKKTLSFLLDHLIKNYNYSKTE